MELKDMQAIWNSETQETLYAINEEALYKTIQKKGRSINRNLIITEFIMISVNLAIGIWLLYNAYVDVDPWYNFVAPVLYLTYTTIFIGRLFVRRKEEVRFENTLIGEIDKALWQSNYLLKQGQNLITWYLIPIFLVAAVTVYLNDETPWLPLLLLAVIGPASYFASKWEARKFYLPKKQELEAIRKTLTSQ